MALARDTVTVAAEAHRPMLRSGPRGRARRLAAPPFSPLWLWVSDLDSHTPFTHAYKCSLTPKAGSQGPRMDRLLLTAKTLAGVDGVSQRAGEEEEKVGRRRRRRRRRTREGKVRVENNKKEPEEEEAELGRRGTARGR
eukprot:971656-Rhodomonas_salina.3